MRMINDCKILGVDPGTNILGYAVLEIKSKKVSVPSMGVIKLQSYPDHQTKLKEIYLQLQDIIETYLPTEMAVETPFYGKNVQSMLKLGRAQGVSIAAAITMGLNIAEYSPKKIKQSITGNGNSSKEQVAGMLQSILSMDLSAYKLDATDALGVAYTHYNQMGSPLASAKKYSGWGAFIKDNPDKIG